jgi:hypothetical protein
MTKSATLTLAFDLCDRRIRRVIRYLGSLHLPYLVGCHLNVYQEKEPDLHIINIICEKISFNICCPETLEFARRHFCHIDHIITFVIGYEELSRRDRHLIWNTDKIQLNSLKRFRVLSQRCLRPLGSAMQQLPQLTGIVSISADEVVLNPIMILRNLQRLVDVVNQESYCFFATSTNGWIKKSLWTYYPLVLCAQISYYRHFLHISKIGTCS